MCCVYIVVHFPVFALQSRGFGGASGGFGVGVGGGDREITENKLHLVFVFVGHFLDGWIDGAATRALKVAIFDQRNWAVDFAKNMVTNIAILAQVTTTMLPPNYMKILVYLPMTKPLEQTLSICLIT